MAAAAFSHHHNERVMLTHAGHNDAAGPAPELLVLVGALALAAGYVWLAGRARRQVQGWRPWRTAGFVSGCVVLALGIWPQASPFPHGDLRGHMFQHLLIGMYAPLGLVLGAPVTLLLRTLRHDHARVLGSLLRSRVAAVVTHPVVALILNVGGLYALYCTPLYRAAEENTLLHHAVHVHFVLAGYLFAYVIAGADPNPHRISVPRRLVLLGVAIAGHAVLAQLLYAALLPGVREPIGQLRGAGDLMYYGGDIAELLLALAVVTTWRPRHREIPVNAAAGTPVRG